MTKLQKRILKVYKPGMPMKMVARRAKCSETMARNMINKHKPEPNEMAANCLPGTNLAQDLLRNINNGKLTVATIRSKADEYLRKAAELQHAAEALKAAGLIS